MTQTAPAVTGRTGYATDRTLAKYILLGMITLGIYGLWLTARSGEDLNAIAGPADNKRTMNLWLLALIVGPVTLGIGYLVWFHKFADRIGAEQARRGLPRTIAAKDYWLWNVLGAAIVVGPVIFANKWLTAMNALAADANARG